MIRTNSWYQFLSSAVEQSAEGIAIADLDGELIYVNPAWAKMHGYDSPKELIGKSLHLFHNQEQIVKEVEPFNLLVKQKGKHTSEVGHIRKDGSPFPTLMTTTLIKDDRGKPSAILGIAQDITGRKLAENELREKDIMLANIASQVPGMFYQFRMASDGTYSVPYSSESIKDIFGCSPEDVQDGFDPILNAIHPEDRDKILQTIDESVRHMSQWKCEYRVQLPGKPIKWVFANSIPEKRADGSIVWSGYNVDITDRKEAEEKIINSQRRYQRLTENSPDMIYRMSLPNGKYEYVSPAAEEITGYSPNEFYKSPTLIKKMMHPDWVDYFHEEWKKLIAGDVSPTYEYQIIHKSGEVKWLNQRNVLIKDESGKPAAIEGIVTDVTLIKQTEEDLRTNQETLQRAQEAARIGNWWYDPVEQHPRWTDEMFRVFGMEPQPIVPKYEEHNKIIHPDDWDRFDAAVSRAINEGIGYDLELKITYPDGNIGYVNTICQSVKDKDGKVVKLIGTTQDITERKKIEEESAKHFAEFQAIFNSITDAIVLVDQERCIVRINPAFTSILGYDFEEVRGKTTQIIYADPEEYYQQGKVRYNQEVATDTPIYEINYRRKDGSVFPSETLGIPVKDSNDRQIGFLGVIRDVTDRKKAEAEKERLEEQLRQSQKMEAVGTMAGGIAHDFNNILTIIAGNAEIAFDDITPDNPARENIEEIAKASDRARDLVNQILAFSRKEKQALIPIQPHLMINETLKLLRSTTPTTVAIIQNISQDCGRIKADPTGLHQILMNLFTNAVHSMDEKGEITVSLQEVILSSNELDQLPARAQFSSIKTPGTYARLSVTDNGTGMDEETVKRIFDPFYTTKQVGKGTGMGLSVVHGIVESHEGFVDVDSEPGQGSTFHVFFPVTEEEEEPVEAETTPPQTGTERILFIDDEESLLVLGKRILDKLGYEVTAESSSLNALEIFKSAPHQFDLIITDQAMPNMSGSELIAEIVKVRPNIPVILCTGYSSKVTKENAKEKGISKFITKPYTKKILAEVVREVLEGKV